MASPAQGTAGKGCPVGRWSLRRKPAIHSGLVAQVSAQVLLQGGFDPNKSTTQVTLPSVPGRWPWRWWCCRAMESEPSNGARTGLQ